MPKSQSPGLAEIIAQAIENAQSRVWTALPGRVVSFDHETQRASVFPLVQNIYYDENEERVAERLPVIPDVPVLFQGCGVFRVTFPISKGDLGLLLFTSCSLDRWLAGDGREVDPGHDRRNDLSDAVFLPGIYPFGAPPTSVSSTAMVLHSGGGAASLLLGGPDADDPIVRRSDLDAFVQEYLGHSHELSGTDSNGDEPTNITVGTPAAYTTPACSLVTRSK